MKRRLKKNVRYGLFGVVLVAFFGFGFSLWTSLFPQNVSKSKDPYKYVDKTIFNDVIPVVNEVVAIKRPYNNLDVKIVKGYYDYLDDSEEQEKSLIYSENTYIQSSGVSYGGVSDFEVLSILDGTVIDVKEDSLLGKIVEIRHSNDIISVYQSLSEVSCNVNDVVKAGSVIGISGISNISPSLGSHLHFELIVKGINVNPENYYDKLLNELGEQLFLV